MYVYIICIYTYKYASKGLVICGAAGKVCSQLAPKDIWVFSPTLRYARPESESIIGRSYFGITETVGLRQCLK